MSDYDLCEEDCETLIRWRGGCRCAISPPCLACTEPITEYEAVALGLQVLTAAKPPIGLPPEVWRQEPAEPVDYMKAARDLCRGTS